MLQNPNVETISNHLTSGGVTTLSGALNPDEPLSFDHWMSSLGVAITVYGGYKMASSAKGTVHVQPKPSVASSADGVLDKPPDAAGSVADDVLPKKPVVGNAADDITSSSASSINISEIVDEGTKFKTIDDLISKSIPGNETKGRSIQYEKMGDYAKAVDDFDSLGVMDVFEMSNRKGKVGKLPDGRTVNVRNASSEGSPTIEVQNGKARIKIRYK